MKKIYSLVTIFFLSACVPNWGPHSLQLNVSEGLELTDRKGETTTFESETTQSVEAFYSGRKKTLTLTTTDILGRPQRYDFKNVIYSEDDQKLHGAVESTGQNVGLEVGKNQVCNPDCESVEFREYERSCTYFERRPYTRCWSTPRGTRCHTEWESIAYPGRERVRERVVTRAFELNGRLFQSHWTLATVNGRYQDRSSTFVHLSGCR